MRKLLSREPTPEMVEANEGHGVALYQSYWDAAPALPEPGEVEKSLRDTALTSSSRGMAALANEAADLIAALTAENKSKEAERLNAWKLFNEARDAECAERRRAEKAEAERDDVLEGQKRLAAQTVRIRRAALGINVEANDPLPDTDTEEIVFALKAENERLREDVEALNDTLKNGIFMDENGVYRLVFTTKQLEDARKRGEELAATFAAIDAARKP